MSWEHRGTNIYYYHKYRLAGELVCRYIGAGQHVEEFAALREHLKQVRLLDRQRIADACHWIAIQTERITRLCGIVDGLLKAAGFYRHRGAWRRRGPITMVSGEEITHLLARERARRCLDELTPAELDAVIKSDFRDVAKSAADELIAKITSLDSHAPFSP